MSNSSETEGLAAKCSECGSEVPKRRRGTCSAACKREAKRRYDRARYLEDREANIERVRQWYELNRDHKSRYDTGYRGARERRRQEDPVFDATYREHRNMESGAQRVRRTGGEAFRISRRDLNRALQTAGHQCTYCKTSLAHAPLEWDHILPVSRGGRHSIGNLAPVCRSCNRSKSGSLLSAWRLKHKATMEGRWDNLRVITAPTSHNLEVLT